LSNIVYNASPTLQKFHADDDFVRMLMGPFGSGKSVGCIAEIMSRAARMPVQRSGKRTSRWVVVRNSYRELTDTTLRTAEDWIPQHWRRWTASDMRMDVTFQDVHLELLFRALDRPDDIKKLLSLELTGAFINESREVPKAVFDAIQGRVGRFPRKGGGGWFGIICDTNPPDTDHWIYRVFEEDRPDGYKVYHQPSGLSDDAENLDNLPPLYYERMMSGKDPAWIDVYVHGKYGYVQDGKPIFPEYNDAVHASTEILKPDRNQKLWIGLDFGLTPAAAFAQETVTGQWRFIDELVTEDMGAKQFGEQLNKKIQRDYAGYELEIRGDPAGDQRAQTDERTPFMVLQGAGINAYPAPDQDPIIRREALAAAMTRMVMNAEPGLQISPKCKVLRKGLQGAYKYRRLQVSGQERYQDKPDKNMYSHVCEAAEYLMVSAGEGYKVMGGNVNKDYTWDKPINY